MRKVFLILIFFGFQSFADSETIVDEQTLQEMHNRYLEKAKALIKKLRDEKDPHESEYQRNLRWEKEAAIWKVEGNAARKEWLEFLESTVIKAPTPETIPSYNDKNGIGSLLNADFRFEGSESDKDKRIEEYVVWHIPQLQEWGRIYGSVSKLETGGAEKYAYNYFENDNLKAIAYLLSKKDPNKCKALENAWNAAHFFSKGLLPKTYKRGEVALLIYYVNFGIETGAHPCKNLTPLQFSLPKAIPYELDGFKTPAYLGYTKDKYTAETIYGLYILKGKKLTFDERGFYSQRQNCTKDASKLIWEWSRDFLQ